MTPLLFGDGNANAIDTNGDGCLSLAQGKDYFKIVDLRNGSNPPNLRYQQYQ